MILYLFGILYCLLGFAVVCEEYFVISLLAISAKFGLSDDVAGATLMAAGTSMPEFFSSLLSLFSKSADNSLGMATVVGSSVYNILIIIGWSAVAGKDIMLDWKPLTRDGLFYFVTIFYLIGSFSGGSIGLLQSGIALALYFSYVYFMAHNAQVFAWMDAWAAQHSPYLAARQQERLAIRAVGAAAEAVDLELLPLTQPDGTPFPEWDGEGPPPPPPPLPPPAAGEKEIEEEEGEDELAWPAGESRARQAVFCVMWPVVAVAKFTIPDCKQAQWHAHFWWTFLTSIIWIAILAYYMVEWAQHCSCIMGVPAIIIGLTVLAAGTSLPDTLSSVVVARKGMGDMAVANAIGSNVFNVLFGLGLPWTVYILYSGAAIAMPTDGLLENSFTMLAVGFVYMGVFAACGFHMTTRLGHCFIAVYCAYVLMIVVRFRHEPISSSCALAA